MKRVSILFTLVVFSITALHVSAQPNLFDEIIEKNREEIEELADPIIQAFGIGVTGGLYNKASTHKTLGFDLGIRVMTVFIPEGKSSVMDTSDVGYMPVPVVQGSVGLPADFELMARGFGVKFEDESISLFGVGVKKNLKSHIPVPAFPDVSAMVAYHQFKASDVLTSNHWSFVVAVSKKFAVITPYAGFGIDLTSMNFSYTWEDPNDILDDQEIDETFSVRTARLTLGLNLSPIPLVNVFADYNISKFSELTAGLAVSFR